MTTTLHKSLRTQLESTIQSARELAERAVQTELERLGVSQDSAPNYLSVEERVLRNRLRAHDRDLGDDASLRQEVAYEHWHRMLFARFLAESNLLIHPEHKVPVSLSDCVELAKDLGGMSPWLLAGSFASHILPQVFREDSPGLALALSRENEKQLEGLLESLPREVFLASDSLGWVYQFWQSKTKESVNASGRKIGAVELPAVTQLFTEPYMVSFLIDNTLGAWWAGQSLSDDDWRSAPDEASLRALAAVPGLSWDYLRFVREDEYWRPASGMFAHWPKNLGDLKILDPSCGSGHFLTALVQKLTPLRQVVEGKSPREAVDAVLRDNIHGLELDQRCVELAAFALAFTAWKVDPSGYRPLPELHLAWVGQRPKGSRKAWADLGLGKQDLRATLEHMWETFDLAPLLGSLIDPKARTLALYDNAALNADLARVLNKPFVGSSDEERETSVSAQGLQKAAALLTEEYSWVVTNVPYLARGRQDEALRAFSQDNYPDAKADLATVFLERCLKFGPKVTVGLVMPQNWLFLTSYKRLRERLLRQQTWNLVVRIGEKGFESTAAAGAFTILFTITRGRADVGRYPGAVPTSDLKIAGLEADEMKSPIEKAAYLTTGSVRLIGQDRQLGNPDARVVFDSHGSSVLLEHYADALNGMHGGDSLRFRFHFWEIHDFSKWNYFKATSSLTSYFGGQSLVFYWPENGKIHRENPQAFVKGEKIWGKAGVSVSMMRQLPVTLYHGEKFDISCTPIVPKNPANLTAIWCFCSSPEYNTAVRKIDQSIKVTNATLVQVPFDLEHWTKVATEQFPNGLPQPSSGDPTQWIFHGHPAFSTAPLQVAMARLVGYHWPAETDSNMELSAEARELVERAKSLDRHADQDGIVCLSNLNKGLPAVDRMRGLLREAFGATVDEEKLLSQAGYPGYTLGEYLRDRWFEDHCMTFDHRPFVWHITDGHRDGFSAFVNYHKLDAAGLDRLIYSYLGDWINRLKTASASIVDSELKLIHAERLFKNLEKIKLGEEPYDIFVRWKVLREQAIGWDPDFNDGVRMNIRPFVTAEVLKINKPPKLNISWKKDRGNDVASAPWFHKFGGDRENSHHTTLEEKMRARQE